MEFIVVLYPPLLLTRLIRVIRCCHHLQLVFTLPPKPILPIYSIPATRTFLTQGT